MAYNTYDFVLRRPNLEADDEPREDENVEDPEMIRSLAGLDGYNLSINLAP